MSKQVKKVTADRITAGRVTAVMVTVVITVFLWLHIGFFCLIMRVWMGETRPLDDFSYYLKSGCAERGLILNESCEFMDGVTYGGLRATTHDVIFRAPETMDLSELSPSIRWDSELETPKIPDEIGGIEKELAFYRMSGEGVRFSLYRSEPRDGYVYFYLSFGFH